APQGFVLVPCLETPAVRTDASFHTRRRRAGAAQCTPQRPRRAGPASVVPAVARTALAGSRLRPRSPETPGPFPTLPDTRETVRGPRPDWQCHLPVRSRTL